MVDTSHPKPGYSEFYSQGDISAAIGQASRLRVGDYCTLLYGRFIHKVLVLQSPNERRKKLRGLIF